VGVSDFFGDFRLRCTVHGLIATKWLKIDQDNVRSGTAKTVARIMRYTQITCIPVPKTVNAFQSAQFHSSTTQKCSTKRRGN